jgi:ATP-dependent Clp protease ATP-binding subunit ClpA
MAIRNALADIRTMKALFTAAENEATALGDEQPGAEHLFLAALTLDDASARSALATLGVTTDQVRSAIARVHATALGAIGVDAGTDGMLGRPGSPRPLTGLYRSTGSAQDLFQRARRLSAVDKPATLRAGHIAIAAAEAEHGTVARLLELLDIDPARLAGAARAAVAS